MGVYIEGMEMPMHCMDCPFMVSRDNDDCILQSAEANENFENWEQMKAGCPLVPVSPHYDLIDHNALKVAVMNGDCETRIDFLKHTMDCINKAPIVIPSDILTYEAEEGEI